MLKPIGSGLAKLPFCLLFISVCGVVLFQGPRATAQVQGGHEQFSGLFDLYAMDRMDDCLWKALRYTEKEKHRNAPEPYLYAAMCFLQMHHNPDLYEEEEFTKPLKSAIKYARKGIRKDRDGSLYAQNKAFLLELKSEIVVLANVEMQENEYRKTATWLKKAVQMDESDARLQLALGISQVLYKNRVEGTKNIETARAALDGLEPEALSDRMQPLMVQLFLAWSRHLESEQALSDALDAMELGHRLIGSNQDIEARLHELQAIDKD